MTMKYTKRETCVADAVEGAINDLRDLGDECREAFDNTPESLQQSERCQTLDNTASQLEGIDDVEAPPGFGDTKVTYQEASKPKTPRSMRRDNAVAALQAVIEAADEFIDAASHGKCGGCGADLDQQQDHDEGCQKATGAVESFRDELQNVLDEADSCEFPGMRG